MSLNWTNLDSRCTQESGIGIQKGFGQEVPQEAALVIGQVDGLGTKKRAETGGPSSIMFALSTICIWFT